MAITTKRKRYQQALELRQQVAQSSDTNNDEALPSVRNSTAEDVAHLIKRPRKDSDATTVAIRRSPYMRLANFPCARFGDFTRQSYRMTREHFWLLYELLEPFLSPEPLPSPKNREDWNQPLRIKASLRFFAGGDPLEIAADHSIPSLWLLEEYIYDVIAAIHACNELDMTFPESHEEQQEIATGFGLFRSDVGINDCCGALGGMLLPAEPPVVDDADKRKPFFNEHRGVWGLNMQAICDYNGRFLEVSLNSPASINDGLAFMESSFRHKLERPGYLADGLSLYAHRYYPDNTIISLPDESIDGENENVNDINHFQLRDQIDAAFSGLLQRWAVLRRPLPLSLGEDKINQLVLALCKLQNFCLDDTELMPPLLAGDVVFGILNGAALLDKDFRPARLLGAGERTMHSRTLDS